MGLIGWVEGDDPGWTFTATEATWSTGGGFENCLCVVVASHALSGTMPNLTSNAGQMGLTAVGGYATGGPYNSGYVEPDPDLNSNTLSIYTTITSGVVPPGTTELTVSNQDATAPSWYIGLLFFTPNAENTCEWFSEVDVDFDTIGSIFDASPQTSTLNVSNHQWFNVLTGFSMFGNVSIGEDFSHADGFPIQAFYNGQIAGNEFIQAASGNLFLNKPPVDNSGSGSANSPGDPAWEIEPVFDEENNLTYRGWGRANWFVVGTDPDIVPFPEPPEEETLATATPDLLIPHKEYAQRQANVAYLSPLAMHQYLDNLTTIENWADGLRCSGSEVIGGGEGGEQILTHTPTDGKWKERQLHIPHKERFSSRNVRENYLAIERWANAICPPLHIPHKDWVLMGNPTQEQINLLVIERWARDIGRCCEGVITDPGPGGGG